MNTRSRPKWGLGGKQTLKSGVLHSLSLYFSLSPFSAWMKAETSATASWNAGGRSGSNG
jgi:hypothetical protein